MNPMSYVMTLYAVFFMMIGILLENYWCVLMAAAMFGVVFLGFRDEHKRALACRHNVATPVHNTVTGELCAWICSKCNEQVRVKKWDEGDWS